MRRGHVVDLIGRTFGDLTVLSLDSIVREGKWQGAVWLCRCACGSILPAIWEAWYAD